MCEVSSEQGTLDRELLEWWLALVLAKAEQRALCVCLTRRGEPQDALALPSPDDRDPHWAPCLAISFSGREEKKWAEARLPRPPCLGLPVSSAASLSRPACRSSLPGSGNLSHS